MTAHPGDPGETTDHAAAGPETAPLIVLTGVGKSYGPIDALSGVDLTVRAGTVSCVLGDNGAGKSTLIGIVSGLFPHTSGTVGIDRTPTTFRSPRQALAAGIATVHQDLAVVDLTAVWRNFFLGAELRRGRGPLARLDIAAMRAATDAGLRAMGITVTDLDQPVGTLSGGQRQCVAIARAVHRGARVLVLDEPTAALGVTQSGVVLRQIAAARDAGIGVVLVTHNPHHAHLVGDHFLVLSRGRVLLDAARDAVSLPDLTAAMAGGAELTRLSHELERSG